MMTEYDPEETTMFAFGGRSNCYACSILYYYLETIKYA